MIILGSTGSIGQNALKLAKDHNISILALGANKNYELLNAQIANFKPKLVYMADKNYAKKIRHKRVFSDLAVFIKACDSQCCSKNTTLINAIVGFAGLMPSKLAQDYGFKLALANKESLVAGGAFLRCDEIMPIDSEHFGLKFLLNNKFCAPSKLIITASGGAVRKLKAKQIANLSPKLALNHPTWDMGAKITIDSATMANKLFEVLEAFWLYKCKNIDALIEKTSTIHALIEFYDGSTTAHISAPDMKLAIAHAIGLESRILSPLNLADLTLKFKKINLKKYPIFTLKDYLLDNPKLGVIVNAANEQMVYKFLKNECGFLDISRACFKALDKFSSAKISCFGDILELDKKVREFLSK